MGAGLVSLLIICIGFVGLFLGYYRAVKFRKNTQERLHSLPVFYGVMVFLFTTIPAFLCLAVWAFIQPVIQAHMITDLISQARINELGSAKLAISEIERLARGLEQVTSSGTISEKDITKLNPDEDDINLLFAKAGVIIGKSISKSDIKIAQSYHQFAKSGQNIRNIFVLGLAFLGMILSFLRITPKLRARNLVETFILALFIGCAFIAIATTLGIILSLVFETASFFHLYPAKDFFLSLKWNPQFRGGSDLGIWPLLWGTLYISFIALLVAVPIGLMTAVYLSEYANPKTRSIIKPITEILAGIPTIVYGLFALIVVGPLLRDYFAQPLGLGSSSSSVMTAGLVMGVMIIPFVSSLSEDIMNAVPQAIRDGSFGLGATKSETIKKVVFPAALPGIVGAVLLAASRAIGETMIVVMGAGAAAKLSLNPFEAMTTITVKIVSQLTGDTEFASPETLVAFALGLTLFCFTLGLNVLALFIVRKYREQYE